MQPVNSNSVSYLNEYGANFYVNHLGQYHREDGPAIIYPSGRKDWYLRDKLHRLDGPAVEAGKDTHLKIDSWYINGVKYPNELTYWLAVTEWKKNHA